jgi:hypothetical protein
LTLTLLTQSSTEQGQCHRLDTQPFADCSRANDTDLLLSVPRSSSLYAASVGSLRLRSFTPMRNQTRPRHTHLTSMLAPSSSLRACKFLLLLLAGLYVMLFPSAFSVQDFGNTPSADASP